MRDKVFQALCLMKERNDIVQDTHGNVSMRWGDSIFIKPSGVPYEQIWPEYIPEVIFDPGTGEVLQVNGDFNPSVDTEMHAAIYSRCPWVTAICHTHSPHVVAFAAAGIPIECHTTEQADVFGGSIDCETWVRMPEDVHFHLQEGQSAILMKNHGLLTFGRDAVHAVQLAIQAENVARKNLLTNSLRPGVLPLKKTFVDAYRERYVTKYGQR